MSKILVVLSFIKREVFIFLRFHIFFLPLPEMFQTLAFLLLFLWCVYVFLCCRCSFSSLNLFSSIVYDQNSVSKKLQFYSRFCFSLFFSFLTFRLKHHFRCFFYVELFVFRAFFNYLLTSGIKKEGKLRRQCAKDG